MKLAVLGAGSWGLTLTWLLSKNFDKVSLWGRDIQTTPKIKEFKFDENVELNTNLENTVKDAEIILLVVSTSGIRPVCNQLAKIGLKKDQIIVNTSKGIELPSLERMSEVIKEELPENKIVVLSGPTLAKEVIEGKPTAASVACEDEQIAKFVQKHLSVKNKFRLYSNNDVIGVELGGSLKNVIAIAAGFADAMKLGDNTKGAILTRGLAEIVRLSIELGANPSTLYGLSGIGDLIATCSSPLSRNYQVGYRLGQGKKLDDILEELGAVAEGVKTSKAVMELAKKFNIETPVSQAIYEAVYTNITPVEVVNNLMNRKLKSEESFSDV